MTPVARVAEAAALERELQVITARVQLLVQRQLAWRETRPGAADPWQDRDDRLAWSSTDERGRKLATDLGLVELTIAKGLPRLRRLEQTFDLDARESSVLQICLAAAIAPELLGVTETVVATLLGEVGRRFLTPQSPLSRWQLVRRAEHDALVIDPAILDWFTGTYAIDEALIALAAPVREIEPIASWPVEPVVAQIQGRWERDDLPPHVRVIVSAPAGSGRRSFAAAVASRLGLGVLAIDADAVDEHAWSGIVRRAHRHAFLARTAPVFVGDSPSHRGGGELAGGFPLVFVCVEPGFTVPRASESAEIAVELPAATIDDRARMWKRMIPVAATWDGLTELASRHRATPADIAFAARRGVTTIEDASTAVRERTRDRLGELAQRLECPFGWSDLVLPPAIVEPLRDYEFEARERASVWELPALRRMFPQGRGLFALFTGPPGTGKTMSAQIIAASLGVDLFRISLSAVVSKYVGETAKNLERVLGRAEHMDALLLFDEADALFGKRTEIKDAHDRYANTDTNHLLQAIESYGGLAILASNKKANIDSAFLRRLRYVVEFPQPDVGERLELWRRLVMTICGEETAARLSASLPAFASAVDVSGAQIKLAVLAALFGARREGGPVSARHLANGVARELLKDGRSLSVRDRERLVGDGA
jgi:hypothetical protein